MEISNQKQAEKTQDMYDYDSTHTPGRNSVNFVFYWIWNLIFAIDKQLSFEKEFLILLRDLHSAFFERIISG